jgi:succinate dehydrogenase hydrophobic anchor subunit
VQEKIGQENHSQHLALDDVCILHALNGISVISNTRIKKMKTKQATSLTETLATLPILTNSTFLTQDMCWIAH